jgi:transposase InsO family protein
VKNNSLFLIDDYSRMTWVTFLKAKSKAFEKLKAFKALVEYKTNLKIKRLRSNKGSEFISNDFNFFCEIHEIKRNFSAAKNTQQNGVVERNNRTIQIFFRTMLNEANLSCRFWREAINDVIYILNREKIRVNDNKTPYEIWKGRQKTVK